MKFTTPLCRECGCPPQSPTRHRSYRVSSGTQPQTAWSEGRLVAISAVVEMQQIEGQHLAGKVVFGAIGLAVIIGIARLGSGRDA